MFSWDIDSRFNQGDAVLWKSKVTTPDLSVEWTEVSRLNPMAGEFYYSVDQLDRSWYALTLEGTWGSSVNTHIDDRIEADTNAIYLIPQWQSEEEIDEFNSSSDDKIELPPFEINLLESNQTIKNGDWITLLAETNSTHEFSFTSAQNGSTYRWSNALSDDPFWFGANPSNDIWTITVENPIKLIHIESTNANGEIDIIRVGIDWDYLELSQPVIEEEKTTTDEKKSSSQEQTISPVLLIAVSIMAAYIVVLVVQRKPEKQLFLEEE